VATTLVAIGLTMVGPAAPATAAALTRGGAFLWLDNPYTALGVPYTPTSTYQYNSTSPFAAINTVTRDDTGSYIVTFPNLDWDGIPHVTAYGGDTGICTPWRKQQTGYPVDIGVPGTGTDVYVKCFGLDGYQVDHQFTITFTDVRSTYLNRPMAYLLANGFAGTVYSLGTFNSSGAANSITRTGTGAYTARLPNLAASAGHVQVTAWPGYSGWRLCKVTSWGPSGYDQVVNVRCYDRTGAPVDVNFTLTYVNQLNILGLSAGFDPDGHDSAYAWANQPGTASYQPSTYYQFDNFTNTAATGTRTATGTYGMKFGYSNLNIGDAQVTAYGGGTQFCGIAYWYAAAGIQVRCYALDGTPADSYYTIAFTGPFVIG
jgi:hypothetical protein